MACLPTPLNVIHILLIHSLIISSLESMKSYFEKFGEVNDSVIMMDKETSNPLLSYSLESRGFGFVTMRDSHTVDIILS